MKHFRIKETNIDENKEYIIQYTSWFLFIKYWRKYNKLPYKTYNDALLEVRKVINTEKDYIKVKKNKIIKYHYVDPFKMNDNINIIHKQKNVERMESIKQNPEISRYNRSVFIPKK